MGLFKTNSIILKTIRLGEADKLVTLLTEKRGKVKGVAKGARRARSRFGAVLEPFTYGNIVFFEKKPTILLRLNQGDILNPFLKIRGNLESIEAAFRMVHLVMALLPEGEANPKVFSLLFNGLKRLDEKGPLEWLIRAFEIRCLKYAGYQARLDECLVCHRELGARPVFFSARNGGALCGQCAQATTDSMQSLSPATLSMMRLMGRMDWKGMFRLKANPRILNEVRGVVDAHLAFILGRPLRRIPLSILPAGDG